MIQFLREDNMAIWLFFNLLELEQLIDILKKVLRGEKESINALIDMAVVTLKKKSNEINVTIAIEAGESTQIIWQDNKII